MQTQTSFRSELSNALLTSTILLANADTSNLIDYCLKAILGGAVWLSMKLVKKYLTKNSASG